ncbi:MAG: NHL repeat-containing protein [Janthinobacterium lividum]
MPSFSTFLTLGALLLGLAACKKDSTSSSSRSLAYTTVSTLAGTGTDGFTDGAANVARFSYPDGAAVDAQGNVYIADAGNSSVRKITPAGVVSTLAGAGWPGLVNGTGSNAQFYDPADVVLDGQNNVYVADFTNNCIRKITPAGVVSTWAGSSTGGLVDGPAATARFRGPNGLAIDARGTLYVADGFNHCIRKITAAGVVSTLAGTGVAGYADGPGSTAQFSRPEGLAVDAQGTLYTADYGDNRIRKITAAGVVSTLAGTGKVGYADGPGNTAMFFYPTGIAVDAQGTVYVADLVNNCIRMITPSGVVSTLAGTTALGFANGPVASAKFSSPTGLTIDTNGILYVTEQQNYIRKIAP